MTLVVVSIVISIAPPSNAMSGNVEAVNYGGVVTQRLATWQSPTMVALQRNGYGDCYDASFVAMANVNATNTELATFRCRLCATTCDVALHLVCYNSQRYAAIHVL